MLSAIISTGMTERDLTLNTQNQTTKILLWVEGMLNAYLEIKSKNILKIVYTPDYCSYALRRQHNFPHCFCACLISAQKMPTVSDPKNDLVCQVIWSISTKRLKASRWCSFCSLWKRKTDVMRTLLSKFKYIETFIRKQSHDFQKLGLGALKTLQLQLLSHRCLWICHRGQPIWLDHLYFSNSCPVCLL